MGRASILILLTLSTSLNPEGAHTNRRANVLRDKPCGRANAEFLFPSILAAEISHRPERMPSVAKLHFGLLVRARQAVIFCTSSWCRPFSQREYLISHAIAELYTAADELEISQYYPFRRLK